jgi:hypothetical protein
MPLLNELTRAFQKLGVKRVPRADRWPVTGITAFYGLDSATKPAPIKNISSSGIYLGIQEPLTVDQIVTLKLQMEGDPELSSELEFTIQARVARQDESGAGFAFIPLPGLDAALWAVLIRGLAVLTDRDQVIHVFRNLRTVLFLCRLCPSGAEEAIQLLGEALDKDRSSTLFRIAREVENRLAAEPDAGRLRVHPKLVASLLRDGSWAGDELTTQMWIGLFVASCAVDEADDSNQIFADLLVQITSHQAKILTHACERTLSSAPAFSEASAASVPGDLTLAPVSGESSTSPASNDVSAAPALGDVTLALASGDSGSAPASGDLTLAPASGEQGSVPASSDSTLAPASGESSAAPESGDSSSVPASDDAIAAPASGEPISAPAPGDSITAPASSDMTLVPASVESNSAPVSGASASVSVILSPNEITKLTGVTDLARNATDLAYLYNLGLLQNLFDFTSYREIERFDITPSRLGLELYRHCHGDRGKIDPELAAAARERLTFIFPPPLPSVFEDFTPLAPKPPQEK